MQHRKKRRSGRGGPTGVRCSPHNKEMFGTRQAAVNALAGYATKTSGDKDYYPRRAYRDRVCGCWHLTSSL